jgi:RNA polymerase sigma-70 factor (ECF subfamily)
MHEMTLTEAERLRLDGADAVVLEMDEEAFRAFYERTARPLWAYLSRITGDRQAADDLLQEAYYRFLRARARYEDDRHRRNSLFQIATNLARDRYRRGAGVQNVSLEETHLSSESDHGVQVERRTDLHRAMRRLKPRERELLWLAYAQGSSHQEIAAAVGVKTASVKLLLFRARRKLADLLRNARRQPHAGTRREP